MARKKVKLEWIANDPARRATFKKRRKGLMKKVSELSTLCGVKACMIVYGHNKPTPEVWPSVPEAAKVLIKLKKMPEMEQSKKMLNQDGFMRQRITKLQDQLRKQDRENRELETNLLMYECLTGKKSLESVGIEDITSLACLVEMKMNQVKKWIEGYPKRIKEEKVEKEEIVAVEEKSVMEATMEEHQRQEWFADLLNPPLPAYEQIGCTYNNNAWMDGYFPLN